jgi:hypothetical protein
MDRTSKRPYEGQRYAALAVLVAFVAVSLGSVPSHLFALDFLAAAAGALGGFFLIGGPCRPRELGRGEIALRYQAVAAALALVVALHFAAGAALSPALLILAAALLVRELRARLPGDWRRA